MKQVVMASCAALMVSATSAPAASKVLVFGDSLSDAGAASAAAGESWPYDVYPNGQATNGDTWAATIGSTFASGYNFAFGSARTVDNGDEIPDFAAQRQSYFSSGLDVSTISDVAIWFGGNDFRDLLSAGIPTPAGVATASAAIITEIVTGIGELATTGLTDFTVFSMPDLSRLPSVVNQPYAGDVKAAVEAFDAALASTLADFAGVSGLNVDFLNVSSVFEEVIADPAAFGFTNTTDACLSLPAACAENPNGFFFFDDIHPTEAIHDLIAAAYSDASGVSEVPLPAGFPLMLSGLALFGLASRRHKSHA